MPKRTNKFQHLIARIEKALSPDGINVTESKELIDISINKRREVDIVIEINQGIHNFIIGIECTDKSIKSKKPRKETVEWIEQMWGKHSTLPTNKLILVSKTGFTETAKQKAEFWNIETLNVEDAESLDWSSKIRKTTTVQTESFLMPYPIEIIVIVKQNESDVLNLDNFNFQDSILHDTNGSLNKTIYQEVNDWLQDPAIIEIIKEKVSTDEDTIIEFTRELKPGIHIFDINNEKKTVLALRVKAKARKEVGGINLIHETYGNAAIAHGEGKTFGQNVETLLSHKQGQNPIISFEINDQSK